jgi:hypothetical protein
LGFVSRFRNTVFWTTDKTKKILRLEHYEKESASTERTHGIETFAIRPTNDLIEQWISPSKHTVQLIIEVDTLNASHSLGPASYQYLRIDITQRRSTQCISQVSNTRIFHVQVLGLDQVFRPGLAARRVIVKRERPSNRIRLVQVQSLPDPIHAIKHGVVQEEHGVDRRGKDVACVAADAEMAGGVQAKEAVGEAALESGNRSVPHRILCTRWMYAYSA